MLSVLIPTYNYNIYPLVNEVYKLLEIENIPFEIICLDDCSTDEKTVETNQLINKLGNTTYKCLSENIGRSKIRNKLAKMANYNWLLFLDADVLPIKDDFIKNYLYHIQKNSYQLVYGGIKYTPIKPSKNTLLRWYYGTKREALPVNARTKNPYISFLTLNFLIEKEVFNSVSFNEDIPNLRHEDTLFSFDLRSRNILVNHINNPVYHLGLETNEIFLEKSLNSVKSLCYLEKQQLIPSNYVKLLRVYKVLKIIYLQHLVLLFGRWFEKPVKKNLLGTKPSLILFDFYRLYYLATLKKI